MHIYPRNPYGREETPRYRDRLGDLDTKKNLGTKEANGFSPSKRDRQPAKKIDNPPAKSPPVKRSLWATLLKHPDNAGPCVHLETSSANAEKWIFTSIYMAIIWPFVCSKSHYCKYNISNKLCPPLTKIHGSTLPTSLTIASHNWFFFVQDRPGASSIDASPTVAVPYSPSREEVRRRRGGRAAVWRRRACRIAASRLGAAGAVTQRRRVALTTSNGPIPADTASRTWSSSHPAWPPHPTPTEDAASPAPN
jgi:hypothetical protein